MSESISPEEQRQIDELAEAVASDLAQGKSAESVSKTLVKQGWEKGNADAFVAQVQTAIHEYRGSPQGQSAIRDAKRSRNQRNMLVGGLWCVGGTAVTLVTYSAASGEGGGTYVVAWGAIIFGALQFLSGMFGSMRD